jgi:hypothetical protein
MSLERQERTKLSFSDIEIGAVEIKDSTTATRAAVLANNALKSDLSSVAGNVTAVGAGNVGNGTQRVTIATDDANVAQIHAHMTDKTQMAQITDGSNEVDVVATINSLKSDLSSIAGTATAVNSGDLSAGVQRVAIATNDINTAKIVTATELIDDVIATIGSAFNGKVIALGLKAESTFPTEVTNGYGVALLGDLAGRIIIKGYDFSAGGIRIVDPAPACQQKLGPITFAQLTAPGSTVVTNVVPYKNFSWVVKVGSINTNVIVQVDGSHNNTDFYNLAGIGLTTTIIANGVYEIAIMNAATAYTRLTFISEDGGTDATLDCTLMAGN